MCTKTGGEGRLWARLARTHMHMKVCTKANFLKNHSLRVPKNLIFDS